jgi:type I restriction enzyme S subunit
MGQSPSSSFVNDTGEGIPFLQGCAEFGALTPDANLYCSRPLKLSAPNDVLISVRAPVGTVNKSDRTYCIGRGIAAIRFNQNVVPDFGWHLLSYWAMNLRLVAQGTTFEAVNKSDLQSLQVFYLPKWEQCRIAEILDTVDVAIRQTDALVAKLKLIKAGLVHDLLTRGLDSQGNLRDHDAHPEQFKDSELGRIPKEWDIAKLGDCAFVTKLAGYEYTKYFDYSIRGEIIAIRVLNIRDGSLDLADVQTIPRSTSRQLPRSVLRSGDLVLSYVGTIGEVALIEEDERFHLAPNVAKISVNTNCIYSTFLLLQLQTDRARKNLFKLSTITSQPSLSMSSLRKLPVALPPFPEQQQITHMFESFSKRVRSEEANRDKLKAVKQGLMQDLLTGRVRVADARRTTGAK